MVSHLRLVPKPRTWRHKLRAWLWCRLLGRHDKRRTVRGLWRCEDCREIGIWE